MKFEEVLPKMRDEGEEDDIPINRISPVYCKDDSAIFRSKRMRSCHILRQGQPNILLKPIHPISGLENVLHPNPSLSFKNVPQCDEVSSGEADNISISYWSSLM